MNLPTIGALIRQFSICDFSIMSKVISTVNARVDDEFMIVPETTGDEIVDIYNRLPYTVQQQFYNEDIITRVEEQGLYTEIKVVTENSLIKETYSNNLSSTLMVDINVILLICFIATALIYRQNTIKHEDQIHANVLTSVIGLLEYIINAFI